MMKVKKYSSKKVQKIKKKKTVHEIIIVQEKKNTREKG